MENPNKIGWSTAAPEFDKPQDLVEWEIWQLVPETTDGFPDDHDQSFTSGVESFRK